MRKLVAALACRAAGVRLYGKPLQLLDVEGEVSILDHLISLLSTEECIREIVLGVSDGAENRVFHDIAERRGIRSISGDEYDVLDRLILCGQASNATDVFRVTTESPFVFFELISEVWRRHVANQNDVTVTDGLPEGSHFEVFSLDALQRSHDKGDRRHPIRNVQPLCSGAPG